MIVWSVWRNTHKLSNITDFLLTAKYAKAKDHKDEVPEFFAVLKDCATESFTVIHNRHAAAPTAVLAAQAAPATTRSAPKPSSELKPDKLSHETTMDSFICMMLQIGASNSALQRELGAIKNPTLQ